MQKPLAAALALLVVVVVGIIGLVAYSYTQIHVSLNDVSLDSIEWAQFSWSTLLKLGLNVLTGNWLGAAFDLIQGVNLNLVFGMTNGGLLPVYIPDLTYDLYINGVSVGQGYSNVNLTINPGETRQVYAFQNYS